MSASSSTGATSTNSSSSARPRSRILVPKVWKRPHSTIYGKNVEFGNSLYSDKIGEIDSRKFNITDPQWSSMRSTSGTGVGSSSPTWSASNQLNSTSNSLSTNDLISNNSSNNNNQVTNTNSPIFSIHYNYNNEPVVTRQRFDNHTDFDTELGLFVPKRTNPTPECVYRSSFTSNDSSSNDPSSIGSSSSSVRKLSIGSINPHSYRPNLQSRHLDVNSDELDLHDRSSPFYTDRWAGKTIRHFDSDLYSNANLFKSMIL